MSEDELGDALAALGSVLNYPEPGDLGGEVGRRLRREGARPRRGWPGFPGGVPGWGSLRRPAWQPIIAAAAIVVALFAGSLVAFPAVREAVADWLGLPGIRISVVPSLSPVQSPHAVLPVGRPVALEEAEAAVPWYVLVPDDPLLGPPDAVYLDSRIPDGVVSLVWAGRPDLPAASPTGVGLLLTEFRGSISEPLFQKSLGPGTAIERVRVNGRIGYWISGAPHEILLLDRLGRPVSETLRLAGDVLMWEAGELTVRIESGLTRDEAIRIAETLR